MKFPKKLYVAQIAEHEGTDDETTYYTASEDLDGAYDSNPEAGQPIAVYVFAESAVVERVTKFKRKK